MFVNWRRSSYTQAADQVQATQQRDLHWLRSFLRRDEMYDGHLSIGPAVHLRVSLLLDAISRQIVHQEDVYWSCRGVSYLLELLLLLRINLAAAMLRDTGLPITEVRQRVGFNDDSHFRRTFRKYLGMAPGEYRREYDQNHASGWWKPSPAG